MKYFIRLLIITMMAALSIFFMAPVYSVDVQNKDDVRIVATDRSPSELKSKAAYICNNGEIPEELWNAIKKGNCTFKFAPGEYLIEGPRSLYVGSHTTIAGTNNIKQPSSLGTMLYPNSSTQAVFITKTALPSTQSSTDDQTGFIQTVSGADDVTISDIAMSGYTVLKLVNAKNSSVSNVLIHNYRGVYPKGQWCNMGYGRATGSLWLFGNCSNITVRNCQIQCSSHHGLALHSGSNKYISRNIRVIGCRALYCGCGQLRGQTGSEEKESAIRVPETNGHGYVDWSVAYDLCENQSVENVSLEDCYALEGWKCGFYTEPEDTGGHIKNLSLKRCRSDLAGQRAVIPGSNPKATIPAETEGSNFFMQGGYFEDCISVKGEKCGWYLDSNRIGANPAGKGRLQMVRCGDMGSPISLVTEMFDCSQINSDGFWSLNAQKYAMWLFGGNPADKGTGSGLVFKNSVILSSSGQKDPPIKIGYMLRQQLRESRNPANLRMVSPGGKYDVLRSHLTDSVITGSIYNLPKGLKSVEIVKGATFNGHGYEDSARNDIGISIKRKSGTLKIEDYVKSNTDNKKG